MIARTDPNWLLSSLAQSAAALVAIVGGFLVSRVVAQLSQRQSIEHRSRELRAQAVVVSEQLEALAEERRPRDRKSFREWALEDALRAVLDAEGGEVDVEALARAHSPRGSTPDEVIAYARELTSRLYQARDAVARFASKRLGTLSVETLRSRGVDITTDDEVVYERVIRELQASESTSPLSSAGMFPGTAWLPRVQKIPLLGPAWEVEQRRHDQSLRDERQRAEELHALKAQLALLDAEGARTAELSGVGGGVAVLAYFAAVGVVAPLIVMATQPAAVPAWARALLVAGFASGLLALLGYLVWSVRQLGTRRSPAAEV